MIRSFLDVSTVFHQPDGCSGNLLHPVGLVHVLVEAAVLGLRVVDELHDGVPRVEQEQVGPFSCSLLLGRGVGANLRFSFTSVYFWGIVFPDWVNLRQL